MLFGHRLAWPAIGLENIYRIEISFDSGISGDCSEKNVAITCPMPLLVGNGPRKPRLILYGIFRFASRIRRKQNRLHLYRGLPCFLRLYRNYALLRYTFYKPDHRIAFIFHFQLYHVYAIIYRKKYANIFERNESERAIEQSLLINFLRRDDLRVRLLRRTS